MKTTIYNTLTLIALMSISSSYLMAQSGPHWDKIQEFRQSDIPLTEDERDAISSVLTMFDGMRAGDSTLVSSVFYPGLTMHTQFRDKEGNRHLKEGSAAGFLEAVGTPHEEMWNEKLGAFDVKVDRDLAQVWTQYFFFLEDRFLHAGTNFFQMYRTDNGWQMYQLSDTRMPLTEDQVPDIDTLW